MSIVTGLKKTRDLISDPERWTQQASARLKSGKPCDHDHDDAVKWDVYGAVLKSSDLEHTRVRQWPYLHKGFGLCPITFNDTHLHSEVIAGINRAIALAVKDEKEAEAKAAKAEKDKTGKPVTSEAKKPQKFQEEINE